MSERIDVHALRLRAEQLAADPWVDVLREGPYLKQTAAAVIALVDAVEAAAKLNDHLIEKADYPPDDAELLWALSYFLERFDFTTDTATRAPANPHPQNTK